MIKTSFTKHLLTATFLTCGALTGGAQAALSLVFTQNPAAGKTTVTLTGTNFTLTGLALAPTNSVGNSSTFMSPIRGTVAFSGPTDTTFSPATTMYAIPNFNYGTGGVDTAASELPISNPYFVMTSGMFGLFPGHESDDLSNFTAAATYSGTFATKGIDTTPQIITFSNGQELSISFQTVPEASTALLCGLASGFVLRRRRRN